MKPAQFFVCLAVILLQNQTTRASNKQLRDAEKRVLDSILGGSYDNRVRPAFVNTTSGEDNPAVVRVNLCLRSISQFDELDMEFKVQFVMRQEWTDYRLAFNSKSLNNITIGNDVAYDIKYLTLTEPDRVWKPDLFFHNEKGGQFHNIIKPNQFLRIYPNGHILYSVRLTVKVSCPMDLQHYPHDKQVCYLKMASYGYTSDDLVLKWNEQYHDFWHYLKSFRVWQFAIDRVSQTNCTIWSHHDKFSCLQLVMGFKRQLDYYMIRVFIPSFLLVVVSWISFWLDPSEASPRTSIGMTCLLTMVTQIASVNALTPAVSYTKAIDVWNNVCLVFVFAALFEFMFQSRRVDNISRVIFPAAFAIFNFNYWSTNLLRDDSDFYDSFMTHNH